MTQYMLLFSLGPVQTFIAQARKTRDLWLGSFLLSALMEVSMEDIESNLIFPVKPRIDRENKIPDLPNKYIAVFDTQQDAVNAAEKSKEKIEVFWITICDEVWKEVIVKKIGSNKKLFEQWNNQIEPAHLFEIFYVVVEGDSAEYRTWLRETQLVFDGRKHLRDFQQQEEAGEKSTISGLRSALCMPGQQRAGVQKFWAQVAKDQSRRDIDQDGSERLDAIDTVKRFAFLSNSFRTRFEINNHNAGLSYPSTSSIATASFLERLILVNRQANNSQLSKVIADWIRTSEELDQPMTATIPFLTRIATGHQQSCDILTLDGDCLFPETFHPQRLKKDFGLDDKQAEKRTELANNGRRDLAKLFEETDKLSILRPTPYYAMIQMDGDKMGRLINGVQGWEEHQAINRAMSNFARMHAPDLVEDKYPGRLIYAGGDDVFALAPLARDLSEKSGEEQPIWTVLDLVDRLQRQYCDTVRPKVIDHDIQSAEPDKKTRKESVTASIGIAIAHHYTSLSYVRRVSKEAEQLAKNHYGRNALVVTVLRRSGEQTRVGCHWEYPNLEQDGQPIPLFLAFYKLFKDDVLSPKCVYNLLEEAPTLVAIDQRAQISEVKRVLQRQRDPASKDCLSDNDIAYKAQSLVALADAMDRDKYPSFDEEHICDKARAWSAELHSNSDYRRYGLVEVLGWLLVMLFLARKEHE